MVERTQYAADYTGLQDDQGWTAADAGRGMPMQWFTSVYCLWSEEVFVKTQDSTSGQILQPPSGMQKSLGARKKGREIHRV